ncbi:hypothetical protein [Paraburkholderia sp. EG304]|uniref:hypothetical protein n=1 Tax=Paraburkholderia sp. EG304 TaxID=3237015 RepID=UPI00397A724E
MAADNTINGADFGLFQSTVSWTVFTGESLGGLKPREPRITTLAGDQLHTPFLAESGPTANAPNRPEAVYRSQKIAWPVCEPNRPIGQDQKEAPYGG